MAKYKVRPPKPDVIFRCTFEADAKNLGDCRNVTYKQMWQRYKQVYTGPYTEWELRQMHLRWKLLAVRA